MKEVAQAKMIQEMNQKTTVEAEMEVEMVAEAEVEMEKEVDLEAEVEVVLVEIKLIKPPIKIMHSNTQKIYKKVFV